ncbi:uncharacterized protein ISCGN_019402 [Ixodes scapularis]
MCLSGEALKVFGRLGPEVSMDYEKTRLALLQRFRFTAEGYKEKFRESKPQDGEIGRQYTARIASFFDRWVELSGTASNVEGLRDLVVAEQFLNNCHSRLALFLRERKCKTLSETAEVADSFLEAQRQRNLLVFGEKTELGDTRGKEVNTTNKPQVKCFVCDKPGHKASDCRSKPKQLYCVYCSRTGHDAKTCTKGSDSKEASCCVSLGSRREHSHQASEPNSRIEEGDRNGTLDGQAVPVLRDTGSNTVVVRRSLVPEAALTGTTATLRLIDGRSIDVPEAQVDITSPYFTGTAVAK